MCGIKCLLQVTQQNCISQERAETCKCPAHTNGASPTVSKVCVPMGWQEADLVCCLLWLCWSFWQSCTPRRCVLLAGDTACFPCVLPLSGSEAGTAITPPTVHPLCQINGPCFAPHGLWYLQSTLMCALLGVLSSSAAMLGKGLDVPPAADPAPNPMRCN